MKLFFLGVFLKADDGRVKLLSANEELSTFGYFQKNSVKEFMRFTAGIVVERVGPNTRSSVKEQEYICHVYLRGDKLAGVVISDSEYPQRVAHTVINETLEQFSKKYPPAQWTPAQSALPFSEGDELLRRFQNPNEADALSRIQSDLDETKIILHKSIEAILERGEKLDTLVDKSENLSFQSKAFYTTAKKTNACCTIL